MCAHRPRTSALAAAVTSENVRSQCLSHSTSSAVVRGKVYSLFSKLGEHKCFSTQALERMSELRTYPDAACKYVSMQLTERAATANFPSRAAMLMMSPHCSGTSASKGCINADVVTLLNISCQVFLSSKPCQCGWRARNFSSMKQTMGTRDIPAPHAMR